jgi:hypothetical protein
MIWSRVRQVNALRSLLREYYPAALAAFGADLADRDAWQCWPGPNPGAGPAAVPGPDRDTAPPRRPATQHRRNRREDQDRFGLRAAERPCGGSPRLRGQRVGADRGVVDDGHPD